MPPMPNPHWGDANIRGYNTPQILEAYRMYELSAAMVYMYPASATLANGQGG